MTEILWVTGVSGFSGRHLVRFVRSLPDAPRVVGLDVRPARECDADALHVVDLSDAAAVEALASPAPPRWVIHLAGLMPPAPDGEMWRANVGGTAGLLVGLRRAGARDTRIVSIGSAAEYSLTAPGPVREDAPTGSASPYGTTKLAQTLMCLHLGVESGFRPVVARPFNLIGPGLSPRLVAGSLVKQFVEAGDRGTIRAGNTHTARDFVDVRDAVRAYWLLATSDRAAGIYNVCSGRPTRIEHLFDLLSRITGQSPRIERDPTRVRSGDPVEVFGDPTRLREATGWNPEIALEASLRDMLEHA